MIRWWISWYEPMPDGDCRSDVYPLPPSVPGWWKTGETCGDAPAATLCAVVDAATEEEAKEIVRTCWPRNRATQFRFAIAHDAGWTPGDRYPLRAAA